MQTQSKKEKRIVKEIHETQREEAYEEPVEIRRTGEIKTQNVTVFVSKKKNSQTSSNRISTHDKFQLDQEFESTRYGWRCG